MSTLGFVGRLWVRWARWAGLSLDTSSAAGAVVKAAYLRGAQDALDALVLSERERLMAVYRRGRGGCERPDAVLAHRAVADAVRRGRKQIRSMVERQRERAAPHTWCGGAARLKELNRELTYLMGEGRPQAADVPWPERMNPSADGRLPEGAGRRGWGEAAGQPTSPSQPTGKEDDDAERDSGFEWYAHQEDDQGQQ